MSAFALKAGVDERLKIAPNMTLANVRFWAKRTLGQAVCYQS